MIRIEQEIDIHCPVAEVFRFMANISNHQNFSGAFTETRQLSAGDFGVGTRVRKVSSFLGKEVVAEQEVIAYEPDQLISLQVISGPVPGQERYVFEEIEGGTRLKVILLARPQGVLSLAAPVLKTKIKNQMAADFYNLKRILESELRR
jgi:uncharacterized membrane protein